MIIFIQFQFTLQCNVILKDSICLRLHEISYIGVTVPVYVPAVHYLAVAFFHLAARWLNMKSFTAAIRTKFYGDGKVLELRSHLQTSCSQSL